MPRLSQRALKALQASIAHHKVNLKAETPSDVRLGSTACALCELYVHDERCGACPVKRATGKSGCAGTPYYALADAHGDWHRAKYEAAYNRFAGAEVVAKRNRVVKASAALFRKTERAEIKFLESLLPKEVA